MYVSNPMSFFHPTPALPPKEKSVAILFHLLSQNAAVKEIDAYTLLHPDNDTPESFFASYNTGKFTKFISYIKNGFPVR